jgi:phosphoribosylamine--glycine ligase
MASEGYPGKYEKDKLIKGLDNAKNEIAIVYHAGTKIYNGKIYTNGGRVLGVTGIGNSIKEAIDNAYKTVQIIEFENHYYRKDIGMKALKRIK